MTIIRQQSTGSMQQPFSNNIAHEDSDLWQYIADEDAAEDDEGRGHNFLTDRISGVDKRVLLQEKTT